jgi:hypothetical protein
MPLDFPSNPTNGQIYGNYYYDTSVASWRSNPLVSGSAFISDNVPSVSPTGSIWYNSTDGTLFVRYGEQWVEARSNQKITPGSIVQVVQGTTTSQFSTTSTSFVDTSLSATITPKFNTSKVAVFVSQAGFGNYTPGNQSQFMVNIVRGSTEIAMASLQMNIGGQSSFGNFLQYLDSPATTSAVTYKTQAKVASTSSTIYMQWPPASGTPISTITLMEVAQ